MIEAGGRWAGHVKIAVRAESQMESRHAGLDGSENKNLTVAVDLENRARTVTDVEVFIPVEGDSRRHAHPLGISRAQAVR